MGSIGEIFADAGLHVDAGSFSQFSSQLSGAESGVSGFSAKSALSIGLIGGAVVAAGIGIAGYVVGIGVSYEKTMTQLTGLLGSQEKAKTMFLWLQDFADTTPFEFPELAEAATKFTAAGMSATEYMTVVGDVAAGTGKSIDQVTEAFIDAQTGEWERLKELGITHTKVSEDNYRQYGATMDQVGQDILSTYDANGKQMVQIFDSSSKEATNAALKNLAAEKFAGSMDAVAQSMAGKWSTIKDNINNALVDIVGFKDGAIQAGSLMAALSGLAGAAVGLSGAFSSMSEPMQTALVAVLALSVAVGGGMAIYAAAMAAGTVVNSAFGTSLVAAFLPVTAVVGAVALVAAGLYILEQKTGLVTVAWNILKDTFTITVDFLKNAFGGLSMYISEEVTKIKEFLIGLIPPELIETINGLGNFIKENLGGAFTEWHTKAEAVRSKDAEVSASVDELNSKYLGGINTQVTGLDDALKSTAGDATTTTAAVGAVNNVSTGAVTGQVQSTDNALKASVASGAQLGATLTADGQIPMIGTIGQVLATDNAVKGADASGKQLEATLTADGQITMGGTTGQLQQIDSTGKATNVTMGQLGLGLKADGSVSFAGTLGQLVQTDSAGKRVVVTEQQALQAAQAYNAQSLAAVRGQIDATISRWQAASKAANDAMVVGHAANVAAKSLAGSYGSSGGLGNTSAGGVKVLAPGQAVQSTSHVTTVNNTYNQPTASDKGTLAIIGRS